MSQAIEVQECKMTAEEFEQAKNEILNRIDTIRSNIIGIAGLLGRMDKLQIREIKTMLKGILSSAHIERLRMFGRGEIKSPWLALNTCTIKAPILKILKEPARAVIDGDQEIAIKKSTGEVVYKKGSICNSLEFRQVIDSTTGRILPPEEQKLFVVPEDRDAPTQEEIDDADIVESIHVIDMNGHKNGLFFRGSNGSCIKLSRSQLKKFFS